MYAHMPSLPITAVSSRAFCPRQAYLAHAERERSDNAALIEGRALHAALEDAPTYNAQLAHESLGIHGLADAIEPSERGPIPVEHKRGEAHGQRPQRVQLALQAMCLEDMLGVPVHRGLILHGLTRDREEVAIDAALRAEALYQLSALRAELAEPVAPPAENLPRCRGCSLNHACLPTLRAEARAWLDEHLKEP